ncbi:helix-turn-helix transcriptional regulator [uncultured Roseibium sp.]|uniref:helix-turn-helix domain-containing protein n=1 Tax=uncultured Roseibium sp. TaxID=1936171 RepID=UPI002603471F|nr:helix-turn-helix transcriptional regulator [uncultured Roseibium sp.]
MKQNTGILPADQTITEQEKAIIAAVRAETDAFLDQDFEAWSACWVQAARTQAVYVSGVAGLSVFDGWSQVAAHMHHVFESGLACQKKQIWQKDHRISIADGTAWVVFEELSEQQSGIIHQNHETRYLELEADGWKVVYSCVIERRQSNAHTHEIAVGKNGHVIWASPECLNSLKQHPLLTVSSGRIRARRLDWDKVLQREFKKAGNFHGFFELHRFASETGGPLQYPVILGNSDDGRIAFVHISVRDCMTYLKLDGDGLIEHRIAVARAVFGLSEGQIRIASLIASGKNLSEIAACLNISVNTARTHLTRLYEKTGVNSQTALVRLLLSVG